MFSREAQRWSSGFSLRQLRSQAGSALGGVAHYGRQAMQKSTTTVNRRRLKPELQHSFGSLAPARERRIAMNSYLRQIPAIGLIAILGVLPALGQEKGELAADETRERKVGFSSGGTSWHGTPKGWTSTQSFDDIRNYATRPEAAVFKTVTAEWQKPELDALGIMCTIRGRLLVSGAAKDELRAVDWFQGMTVYMGIAPATRPDWKKGMNESDTVANTAVVGKSGEFKLRFDLRETNYSRNVDQQFQFGAALATHRARGKTGQWVVWNSRTSAISSSVQMLPVPAAPQTSHELELVIRAGGWPFSTTRQSDPSGVDLIRAVNALQKLGKEQALATLEEYVELIDNSDHRDYGSDQEIVFWIIRLLFKPIQPGNLIPSPAIAVSLDDRRFADAMKWPLNPLEVVDDVPFMVGLQIAMGGMPEHPSSHIAWARQQGAIRDKPLAPTTNPLRAAEAILSSRRFKALENVSREQAVRSLRLQAHAMVKELVRPIIATKFDRIGDEKWKAALDEAAELGIHWDAKSEQFVIEDKKAN
jgi:hypothetical protein